MLSLANTYNEEELFEFDKRIRNLLPENETVPREHEDVRLCIVRNNERKGVISRGSLYGYHYVALAHKKIGKNMEPYIIEPAFEEKAFFSHEGEEFMYVLEGIHEFIYDDKKYILEPGDSIYFDSIIPHSGRSIGKQRAKVLGIAYAYKRQAVLPPEGLLAGDPQK